LISLSWKRKLSAEHLFLQVVSRRHERDPMLVTSSRAVAKWGGVFGDHGWLRQFSID
jgi:hypothetical protein